MGEISAGSDLFYSILYLANSEKSYRITQAQDISVVTHLVGARLLGGQGGNHREERTNRRLGD